MPNRVFVLDTNRQALAPCHPARARELLRKGKAAVFRRYPFTIILNRAIDEPAPQPVQFKVDPGAKTTGLSLVQGGRVIWAGELEHRGQVIKDRLEKRRGVRRGRRNRKTRYRKPRFDNRRRADGWLAPSLQSRVDNIVNWFIKLNRFCAIDSISMELVRFDTQKMANPEISGVEYQQGELAGYEVREYLLEKFERTCAYCGKRDVPLEIEHLTPKSRGGSDRVSNLAIACRPCNQKKGNMTAEEFCEEYGYPNPRDKAKRPLRSVAAVNSVRWALWRALAETGLPLETGTGGRTKYNRTRQNYPKAHWIDAACVGESGGNVRLDPNMQVLAVKAKGRGSRQMCKVNKYGFPRTGPKTVKRVHGFQTGDIGRADIPTGKYAGVHVGRVAVRATGRFKVGSAETTWKYVRLLQRTDGYEYTFGGGNG